TEKERLSEHENQVFEKIDFNKNINIGILDVLYKHQIQSVIIEGGAVLLESFIKNDLWDEARVFTSDLSFEKGIKAPEFNTNKAAIKYDISDNTLEYFYHTTEY